MKNGRSVSVLGSMCVLVLSSGGAWGAQGCTNGFLLGIYNAEQANASFQSVLQALKGTASASSSTTASAAPSVTGFVANANSLSGSVGGLGRYYFDGTGNIVGVSTGTPAVNILLGKYTVNTDCSARITLNSGAAYDAYLANGGKQAMYVRTDAPGGGNTGTLRRTGSCVNLSYPNSYTYAVHGGSKATDSAGDASFTPWAAIGNLNLNGSGQFTLSQSVYGASGVTRTTSNGTYTVGADCSVSLKFTSSPAPLSSFKALMVDSGNGFLSIQPDGNSLVTGTLVAQ